MHPLILGATPPIGLIEPPAALILPDAIRQAMVGQALAARPVESVGLLATVGDGPAWRAVGWFPGANVDASPSRYTMDRADVRSALDRIARRGWLLGGIVHSHPDHPAVPSATDIREQARQDALMVIISLAGGRPDVRAWRRVPGSPLATARMAEVAIRTGTPPAGGEENW